jgi:DNA-binding winged helix-turn-helix (wHTH) protein
VYRFGAFRVDIREQRLTCAGERVPITPKVFDTLALFLRHPGRLLTREELLRALWPDTVVEESNLTVNVSTLRRLLTGRGAPPCIETVARRGYRFVLPVEVEEAPAGPPEAARSDRPSSVRAQELYARANQAAHEADHWETARDLYQACVDEAPDFAPAWARLARCHRVIAKYTAGPALRDHAQARAAAAFERALALDPSLPLTHSLYAQLEVDLGRAPDAMVRLLRLIERSGPDAAAYAGLVHALRFCGLLEASRAAHDRARALDPSSVTSVAHTYWLLGEYEAALRETIGDIGYMPGLALASLGRTADAIAALRWHEPGLRDNRARAFVVSLRALLEGRAEESRAALARAEDHITDPEARYYVARSLARLGATDAALASLRRVVGGGYFCYPAFKSDPWLDGVRGTGGFAEVLDAAFERHQSALAMFAEARGMLLLAMPEAV